jgi:hypothetical protein
LIRIHRNRYVADALVFIDGFHQSGILSQVKIKLLCPFPASGVPTGPACFQIVPFRTGLGRKEMFHDVGFMTINLQQPHTTADHPISHGGAAGN